MPDAEKISMQSAQMIVQEIKLKMLTKLPESFLKKTPSTYKAERQTKISGGAPSKIMQNKTDGIAGIIGIIMSLCLIENATAYEIRTEIVIKNKVTDILSSALFS